MSNRARAYVAAVGMLIVLGSGPAAPPTRAFFGLDPASWIVVGQMASVVSNMMAMRDTMMRIRDEALGKYRGLVDPIDDFAGQMRAALGAGASIDLSAFGGQDPRELQLEDCASLPPEDVASTPCAPDAYPAAGSVYADLPKIDPDVASSLEDSHELRGAEFAVQLAEADHREELVEEALVAVALYLGCEETRADADSRGVVVCPASRSWTAAEREGLRERLADSVADLSTADCPATGPGGVGQGVCASEAQHRSLAAAAAQAQANIDAVLLKLDAEDADRERREFERELMLEARAAERRLDRLTQLATVDLSLDTPEGRANVLAGVLGDEMAAPLGTGLFVGP